MRESTKLALATWMMAGSIGCGGAGCSTSSSAPPPKPLAAPTVTAPTVNEAPKPAAPKPPEPHLLARVFVDTSGSMWGFFDKKTQNVVALHAELDTTIAELGLRTAAKCTVGLELKCAGAPSTPAQLGDGAAYHEAESRIDKVMARAPLPAQIDPNNPPPPDLLDDARLSVLVTDGMESTSPGRPREGAAECAQGADPTCIQSLLRKRIKEGFGVWLVGVLLPFKGTHYPERTIIPAEYDEVKKHVDQLKFEGQNRGVQFSVGPALATEKRTGNSTYHYEGYKPILLVAFSREPALGRAFVATLTQKLRRIPIQPGGLGGVHMNADDAVQSVELAPLSPSTVKLAKLELLPRAEQKGMPPGAFPEFRLEAQKPMSSGLSSKVWCGPQGGALLAVDYERAGDGVLPGYYKEEVRLVPGAAPPRSLAPPTPLAERRLRTGVNCVPLQKGHTELQLALETHYTLDENATRGQWWSREKWSGEDTWKTPERLYGLEDLVLPILRERAAAVVAGGMLHVHVQHD